MVTKNGITPKALHPIGGEGPNPLGAHPRKCPGFRAGGVIDFCVTIFTLGFRARPNPFRVTLKG